MTGRATLGEGASGPSAPEADTARGQVELALQRLCSAGARASGAVLDVFPERAVARATALDALAEESRGPLHGVPFLAKGNMAVAEQPNVGMGPYAAWRAVRDAASIELLEHLGAVLVGRSRFTEIALGSSEAEVDIGFPCVSNPWDRDRTVGGSSSGAAVAVALGLVPLALGTDTGGSVRIPAAFAGVAGIKTTDGLISREGVLPVSWTLDQVGLLADDVQLLRTVVTAVGGDGGRVQAQRAQGPLRVGVVRDVTDQHPRTHPDVAPMLEHAVTDLRNAHWSAHEVVGTDFLVCQPTLSAIVSAEAARSHGPATAVTEGAFGRFVRGRISAGAAMSEEDYVRALTERSRYRERLDAVMQEVDVLLLATIPFPAPRVEEVLRLGSADHAALTRLSNLAGTPAVSVPGAWTADGLPIGCQLVARRGDDLIALEAAAIIARGAAARASERSPA
jgi:aspartyl-tRNA(Asn)/glutamyl-tRNA(Gln) amidotransferase subunit A